MKIVFLSALFATVLLSSCSSDDDTGTTLELPEEVITNVNVTLTSADGTEVELLYADSDGFGLGEAGEATAATLEANTVYTGSFEILNELADEVEEMNVTAEIDELADEHQFFFEPLGGLDIADFAYNDMDGNGYPVGLDFTITTGAASSGILTITLLHEPNKSAEGVSENDTTNEDQGESDFFIDFPITVN